jgi:hypothetical protein
MRKSLETSKNTQAAKTEKLIIEYFCDILFHLKRKSILQFYWRRTAELFNMAAYIVIFLCPESIWFEDE